MHPIAGESSCFGNPRGIPGGGSPVPAEQPALGVGVRVVEDVHEVIRLGELVANRQLGGLCAQYLLLSRGLIGRHREPGQALGSGFASSRYGLYRELQRDIDWIFTNHAVRLCRIRDRSSE